MNKEIQKPENSTWTDDQWRAIITTGNNVLVAAAAGSGKTAVLVERIIKKVTSVSDPVDVDRLLIVTFTNAAAAEMRKRIGEALEKEIANNPASLHLRRQLSLLNRASISTLHSFCLNVLRKYYYNIDLDPGFRIADETEAELLMEEVIEELFDEQYSLENNERFYDLVDRYSDDRSDIELQLLVRKLYDFSRSHPWPIDWLDQIVQAYEVEEGTVIDDITWMQDLKVDISLQLKACEEQLKRALDITKESGGPYPYAENIVDDQNLVNQLLNANDSSWNDLYEQMQALKFGKLKPCKGDEFNKVSQEKVKALREQVKKQINKLQDELFSRKPESYIKDLQEMKPVVETLIELVKNFSGRYEAMKKEKGIVDFADLEHYCLEILKHPNSNKDEIIPSEVAQDYRDLFLEVLVDEYQDTNLVQETIIRLVTCSNNLFMVGDVKQSIYRFRLAEPHLFLTKYKQFEKEDTANCPGIRIDLSKNFRSRAEVLDGTNYIFKQIMNETVGEIDYDIDAELKLGNVNYPESTETKAEMLLIDRMDVSVDEVNEVEDEASSIDLSELETVQLEARVIGLKIKELIEKPYKITDKSGHTRNVTYRDIVILLRSMPWAETIMEEFKELGIPIYAELSTGYFEAVEVSVMMSLLRVIDNPYQDIPLVAILRSPIVGLTEDELATIRIHEKQNSYFECVKSYINTGKNASINEKLNQFYTSLKSWRIRARQGSLSELIWQIYRETGYFDYVGGLLGGKQRQANLRALYDRSKQYEETSFRGLFRFLRFVERMQDRGDDLGTARALGEQEDVVRMMTIHKSKGLEFPVVFVAGLGRQFNMQDLRKKVLLHKELGFASKLVDPKLRISYPMLPLLAMKRRMKMELMAEEMRVLYVALTRAKEKLFLVGTVKNGEKTLEAWEQQAEANTWLLPDYARANAKSYIDWIGPALMRHEDCFMLRMNSSDQLATSDLYTHPSKWEINVLNANNFPSNKKETEEQDNGFLSAIENWQTVSLLSGQKTLVNDQLSWVYQYQDAKQKRSKQSVSEIKSRKQNLDAFADTQFTPKFQTRLVDRPNFLQQKTLTPAERGTAMHMVMQHVNLIAEITEEAIMELLESMVTKELLTEEQKNVVDVNDIVHFFETPLGQRLLRAKKVRREVPFSLALPAKEAYPDWTDEDDANVLVQGVMDCVIEDDDGIVLIDFKTDATKGRFPSFEVAEPLLADRYRLQIDLYARALQEIWKLSRIESYLYFFDGGHIIKM